MRRREVYVPGKNRRQWGILSWYVTLPLLELKHTYQLRGMASTLRMHTTIPTYVTRELFALSRITILKSV